MGAAPVASAGSGRPFSPGWEDRPPCEDRPWTGRERSARCSRPRAQRCSTGSRRTTRSARSRPPRPLRARGRRPGARRGRADPGPAAGPGQGQARRPDADRMWFTADGLEQATRPAVAARHAGERFAAGAARSRVADLCCGIGGDLLALARAGSPGVLGVDRDPLTAAVAAANAAALGAGRPGRGALRATSRTSTCSGVDAAFVDPARRRGARPGARPAPLVAAVLVRRSTWRARVRGDRRQAGARRPARRAARRRRGGVGVRRRRRRRVRAVVRTAGRTGARGGRPCCPSGATLTGDGQPGAAGRAGRALPRRAGRRGDPGRAGGRGSPTRSTGRLLDPTIAYLTCDAPAAHAVRHGVRGAPTCCRSALKRLRALLRERGVGRLTVKKRGTAVQARALRQRCGCAAPPRRPSC